METKSAIEEIILEGIIYTGGQHYAEEPGSPILSFYYTTTF